MKATWPACFHRFFSALAAHGPIKAGAPGSRTEWSARCPAHDDTVSSLSVGRGRSGALVVKCHAPAGCTTEAIVKALGIEAGDLFADNEEKRRQREAEIARQAELARAYTSGPAARFIDDCYRAVYGLAPVNPAPSVDLPKDLLPVPKKESVNVSATATGSRIVKVYDYRDEAGNLLFQTVRREPKEFRQRRPNPAFDSTKPPSNENPPYLWSLGDARRVLYRLPELLKTWSERPKKLVCVVEGEKDADLLMAAGIMATTCPMGANKWDDAYTPLFFGRYVVVIPDEDPVNEAGYSPGLRHAYDVARRLSGVAAEVRLLRLPGVPPKGDVSDWWLLNADPAITVDAVKGKFADLIKRAPVFDPAAPPPPGAMPPGSPALPGNRRDVRGHRESDENRMNRRAGQCRICAANYAVVTDLSPAYCPVCGSLIDRAAGERPLAPWIADAAAAAKAKSLDGLEIPNLPLAEFLELVRTEFAKIPPSG